MKMDYTYTLVPFSEAEKYFCEVITPKCKDKVKVILGAIIGLPYNQYTISARDRFRCRKEIRILKGN
jgi:hypothetical protein